ncbi:LysR family transcriptional regulator [Nitrogeniibacter mangrovi]|uniref:LysR family transcriptional regulator n=1 Tax=Nitrogeniibacter mangrovi TaxID=2016596 RepID=A0A6C1B2I1_9RHOO|nr:LysR family transcriptional regulator [Nitrogeniibacter mangrovi]QID17851.1 LysR family transcriptional regulator [Nitrogeniibacter mangrovi]
MTQRLKLTIRVLVEDTIALGPGKISLLESIAQNGSISAAARNMGMSYARAWRLVDDMNRCFTQPLVLTASGGRHGGGAQVTEQGKTVLAIFREMEQEARRALLSGFEAVRPMLRERPAE